jgi:hypothetical protein
MRDDFLTRGWADNHGQVRGAFHKFINMIVVGFDRLHANRYDAPWRQPACAAAKAPRA